MEIKTTMQIHKGYNDLWEDIEKVKSIDILKSALGKKWVAVDDVLKLLEKYDWWETCESVLKDIEKELSEVKDDKGK